MGLKKLKFISSKNNLVMEEYKFYCFSYINYIFLMHLDLSLGDFGNKNIKITTFKKKKKKLFYMVCSFDPESGKWGLCWLDYSLHMLSI